MNTSSQIKTFLLVTLLGSLAHAQANISQLPSTGKGIAAYTPATPAAATTPTPTPEAQQQDANALMEAFKSLMSGLGGGGGGQGQGSNPEMASGGAGANAGGGDFGGGGATGDWNNGASNVSASELDRGKPIVEPFERNFDKCTQQLGFGKCKFDNQGITGDAAHRARRSCHNANEAIDVGQLTCEGAVQIPPKDPRFLDVAKCLAHDSNNELEIIFHKGEGQNMMRKSDHVGHMHVQLKNCRMIYGR